MAEKCAYTKNYLKMTRSVLAAAILQGKVLVFFMRSNRSGINLVWMVTGLMQFARQENFSKQSACSLQFLVRSTVASQWSKAAERSALNWPPWPNWSTPKRAKASITWTMFVIIASKTSTLSSAKKKGQGYVSKYWWVCNLKVNLLATKQGGS